MERFFKPLKIKKRKEKIATADIEANQWVNFEMIGFFDGRTFTIFDNLASFIRLALSHRYRGFRIYAHFGGKYDFLFLAEELKRLNVTFKMINQGASITAIVVTNQSGHTWTFCDSFRLLPASLDSLSNAFQVRHGKKTGAIDFEKECVDRNNPKHCEYLEYDCRALYEVIRKFEQLPLIERTGLRLTTASQSMAVFRSMMKKPIRVTNQRVQDFVRSSYFGGRCEIFKQEERDFQCYDVNSLFPTQMRFQELPIECLGRASSVDAFGFHDVTISSPDLYIPVLPVRAPANQNGYRKLIFPNGTMRGVWFSEELRTAIEAGYRVEKYHRGYEFSREKDLFSEYVDSFYRMRTENPGDNAFNFTGKLCLNSLYGKFGQSEERTELRRVDPENPMTWPEGAFSIYRDEEFFKRHGLIEISNYRRAPFQLVHISAAITAWARIHMYRNYYARLGEKLVYTDTDSIFCREKMPTGAELGELKDEYLKQGGISHGYFLLPKCYYLELNNGDIVRKVKGFKKQWLKNMGFNEFKRGKFQFSENSLSTFRYSLIKNDRYLSMVDRKRSILSVYDKRVTLPSGYTRPLEMMKGKAV